MFDSMLTCERDCVCVRESERNRLCVCVCREREKKRGRESMCVSGVCMREREYVCVHRLLMPWCVQGTRGRGSCNTQGALCRKVQVEGNYMKTIL